MPILARGSIKSSSQLKRTQNFYQINKTHKFKIQPHKKTNFSKKKKSGSNMIRNSTHLRGGGLQSMPKGSGDLPSWRCFGGLRLAITRLSPLLPPELLLLLSTKSSSSQGVVVELEEDEVRR